MHIVLSGASSGIGRELALLLDQPDNKLSLCGRSEDKLQQTTAALKNVNCFARAFCVSHFDDIRSFCVDAEHRFGPADILINCAGLNNGRAAGHELEHHYLDWMMRINCYAPIEFMRAVVPQMQTRQRGSIVNVLSTTALYANPGIAGYSASKAALDAYSKVMRKELRKDNIKMLSLYPGGVDTDFRDAERPQYLQAKDVAEAVLSMLKSSDNAHIHELIIRPQCEENFS
ncbi:SDR family oxidoreductase [Agaribacterium haliotis]|uniref:SDR family oxidoreductase n=1 Tax=Agaribacterium haliotis TaxID=2013869 RepID=UPI000BB558F5|nr:SDR family NAD(P)-dependent oxidoreductase [Agaribacterium haliotis]